MSSSDGAVLTDGESAANEGLALDHEPVSFLTPAATGKFANEGPVGDVGKDPKREVLKRKQLSVMKEKPHKDSVSEGASDQVFLSGGGSNLHNQRHRPPMSARINSASSQPQLATSVEGSAVAAPPKISQRREVSGRNSSRGALSPRDQQSPSHATLLQDSPSQQQGSPQPAERAGKRPPRPQNIRMTGKEPAPSLASHSESDQAASLTSNSLPTEEKSESFPASGSERQDTRRVRNKDRPDRPVWTPRRRSDPAQTSDQSSSMSSAAVVSSEEKSDRGPQRQAGKAISIAGQNVAEENKVTEGAAGQQPDGGARSQSGLGAQVGKVRHVESVSNRSARVGRPVVPGSYVSANQEHVGVTNQGAEQSCEYSSVLGTTVDPPISLYNTKENGESQVSPSVTDKEKRKQDVAPQWNELTGNFVFRTNETAKIRNR